jgi:hypothetical protein
MSIAPSGRASIALAAAGLLLGLAPVLAQQLDAGFMPKGGKTLLMEVLGGTPKDSEVRAIVEARRTEAEWREAIAPRTRGLTDRELRTLAAYLAVNMPVPDVDGVTAKAAKPGELEAALPRDGRELAWNECQYCHSLFTSHLTQDREVQAWLNMFQSPFHREMKMTPQERREFSTYSAINMPMRIEDVPAELRF